jgi:hypothetical protein
MKDHLIDVVIFVVFLFFLLYLSAVDAAPKDLRIPIKIPGTDDTFLPPDIVEIRTYFLTITMALLAFAAKEIYSAFMKSKDTTAEDIREIKKDLHILLNQMGILSEQMKNKPGKEEVTKEIVDRVQREVEYVSKIQGR